jgi:multidrug transporter EmrE-like cation transporter
LRIVAPPFSRKASAGANKSNRVDRPILGIAANTAAFATVSVSDAMAKLSVALIPFAQALSVRCTLMLFLLSPLAVIACTQGKKVIATERAGLHLLRFAFYAISTIFFFLAVGHLEFTLITAILLLTPVFSTLAGIVLFKETIRSHQIAAALGRRCIDVIDRVGFVAGILAATVAYREHTHDRDLVEWAFAWANGTSRVVRVDAVANEFGRSAARDGRHATRQPVALCYGL